MERRTHFGLAFALCVAAPAHAYAGALVTFESGPGGSTRVNTPWGIYIAETVADRIWIGSEVEWANSVADRLISDGDAHAVKTVVDSTLNRHNVIKDYPQLSVGGKFIYSIKTYMHFNDSPSAGKMSRQNGSEYFGVDWKPQDPSQKIITQVVIGGRSYTAHKCTFNSGFNSCEFYIPKSEMSVPGAVYFVLPDNNPAAIPMKSVTWNAFRGIRLKYLSKNVFPISRKDAVDLKNLHRINSAIPATFKFNDPMPAL